MKSLIIKETTETIWTTSVTFTPVLLDETFGDGEKIAIFQTMNDRPLFWLVLVDSKTDFDSDEDDNDALLQDVWGALECEFGERWTHENDIEEEHNYPAVSGDSGTSLGDITEDYRKELMGL